MRERSTGIPYLTAIALSLLIAGPWLLPGYLFGTDWPGPRHFTVPSDLSSGTLLDAVLVVVSAIITAELTTKVLIVLALLAGALGAFRSLPVGGFIPRAMASLIYVFNPFVYGRIHYGQLALIAAYALLPWITGQLLARMREPNWRTALVLAAELAALGILDLHLLIPAGLLLVGAGIAFGIVHRGDRPYVGRLARNVALALAATAVASSYWLVPLLSGANSEGQTIANIGTADLAAYSVSTDPTVGLIPNLLGLYGFWAENTGRFTSMKAFVPLWPVVLLALLTICLIGVISGLRRPNSDLAPWVGGLVLAATV